jgi:NAD(P)H-dependent flavin oxidoreductase YrpB (nitropropane dioxygenase family)
VEAQCAAFIAQGCAGVDLLAYRAIEDKPLELVRAARRGLKNKPLICAGGVDSPARIAALREAGADGFTVGSAAFDGIFAPGENLTGQLKAILSCV